MASHESDASEPQLSLLTIGHDPLMMILDQIPIMERIRLERVCRSAGSVVAASLRRLTQLDFSEFAQIKREEYMKYLHLPNGVLSGILRRFREHVRSVKFFRATKRDYPYEGNYPYDTTKEILSALIQFQPFNQLQKLYLGGFTIYSGKEKNQYENLKLLQRFLSDPSMKSLRVLGYLPLPYFTFKIAPDFLQFAYATCIQSVLKNCRNLVELKLHYNRRLQLEGLFSESLESIELLTFFPAGAEISSNCYIEMEKLFGMKMPSLQRIVISHHEGKMSFGPDFAESFPSLKVMEVLSPNRDCDLYAQSLKGILETELTQLSLPGSCYGGDDSLSSALESLLIDIRASLRPCRLLETLKILHLPYLPRFSNKTVEMIRLFSNLEELSLEGSWSRETVFIDPMFRALPKLTILNVRLCSFVHDSTLETIGAFCPRIKYLDVSFCSQITDAGIQSMIEALAANPDRADTEELKINVAETSISLESSGSIKIIPPNV